MLAAALVPHPPLLVPELAAGAAESIAPLLAACEQAIADLLARSPQTVVLIGSGTRTARRGDDEIGALAGFGAPVSALSISAFSSVEFGSGASRLGTGTTTEPVSLPLSLTIGRWLLARAGWTRPVLLQEVAAGTSAEDCASLGRALRQDTGPEAVWLALGDGSTRRGPRSPGHDDPRAPGFDAEVARAFGSGDLAALLSLDVELAAELGAAGRPVWQVLAAAVAAGPPWPSIAAKVHYDDAPFGVEYLVATWTPTSPTDPPAPAAESPTSAADPISADRASAPAEGSPRS